MKFPTRSPHVASAATDEQLIADVRRGDRNAYGELWRRHSGAGIVAARSFKHLAEPDDLVAEAFTAIYRLLQGGTAGPTGAFRPYLYTTIRNLAVRNVRHLTTVSDVDIDTIDVADPTIQPEDLIVDKSLTVTAFRTLPERWQTVLWYVEVEQMSASEAGELMNLKPNAVTALVFRARKGLRSAWLQSHVADQDVEPEHRFTREHIGEYTADALNARDTAKVKEHLDDCARCSAIVAEVDNVAGRLAIIVLPLLLGSTAAAAFIHSINAGANVTQASAVAAPTIIHGIGGSGGAGGSNTGGGAGAAGGSGASVAGISIAASAFVLIAVGTGIGIVAMNNSATVSPSISRTAPVHSDAPAVTNPIATAPAVDEAPVASVVPAPVAPTIPVDPPQVVGPSPVVALLPAVPETVPPVVSITPVVAPELPSAAMPVFLNASGAELTRLATAAIHGTATPGSTVLVSQPGMADALVPVDATGSWTWTASGLSEGANPILFSDQQEGHRTSSPATYTVTVDSIAPDAPVILSPVSNTSLTAPALNGTAEPSATLTITDGVFTVTTAADDAGNWSTPSLVGMLASSSQISATQADAAGNISSPASVTGLAFIPTFVSPTSGETVTGSSVTFDLAGWPGQGVVLSLNGQLFSQTIGDSGHLEATFSPVPSGDNELTATYGTCTDSSCVAGPRSTDSAKVDFVVSPPAN